MLKKSTITNILNDTFSGNASKHNYSIKEVNSLCDQVQDYLSRDPSLLVLSGPICICGDIHGQINDLVRIIKYGGEPPSRNWLFLGDYVDRGDYSLEVICFLFALKISYPTHIYLLRGNHENPQTNLAFGFTDECETKLNYETWIRITKVFEYLPFAAVVDNSFFCVHGGLSPELITLEQINSIKRPIETPPFGFLADLLWSDPDPDIITDFAESPRGNTFVWGISAADTFLMKNNLIGIIRAHQMVQNGYEYPFGSDYKIFTVFSAPDYNPNLHNNGAFFIIDGPEKIDVQILQPFNLSPGGFARSLSQPSKMNNLANAEKPKSARSYTSSTARSNTNSTKSVKKSSVPQNSAKYLSKNLSKSRNMSSTTLLNRGNPGISLQNQKNRSNSLFPQSSTFGKVKTSREHSTSFSTKSRVSSNF